MLQLQTRLEQTADQRVQDFSVVVPAAASCLFKEIRIPCVMGCRNQPPRTEHDENLTKTAIDRNESPNWQVDHTEHRPRAGKAQLVRTLGPLLRSDHALPVSAVCQITSRRRFRFVSL